MNAAIKKSSTSALVQLFVELCVKQERALLFGQIAQANRLYHRIKLIEDELRSRPADQRSELLPLLDRANVQVRLRAAKSTLAIAPAAARATLQALAVSEIFPQAGDAGMCLWTLDEGIFKPV